MPKHLLALTPILGIKWEDDGAEKIFEWCYLNYAPALIRWAYSLLRRCTDRCGAHANLADAENVVIKIFTDRWENRKKYNPYEYDEDGNQYLRDEDGNSFLTWLDKGVWGEAMNECRRICNQRMTNSSEPAKEPTAPSGDRVIETIKTRELIDACIAVLEGNDKVVFELMMAGESDEEIAAATGLASSGIPQKRRRIWGKLERHSNQSEGH
jgi:DNA-directed RNA polymerase specialized sigma24 family protein